MSTETAATLDVRQIPPPERHARIFSRFDALEPGQALQLVNDHDPQPLRRQFEDRLHGSYDWTCLQSGPDLWRVRIGKLAARPSGWAEDSCCAGGA